MHCNNRLYRSVLLLPLLCCDICFFKSVVVTRSVPLCKYEPEELMSRKYVHASKTRRRFSLSFSLSLLVSLFLCVFVFRQFIVVSLVRCRVRWVESWFALKCGGRDAAGLWHAVSSPSLPALSQGEKAAAASWRSEAQSWIFRSCVGLAG